MRNILSNIIGYFINFFCVLQFDCKRKDIDTKHRILGYGLQNIFRINKKELIFRRSLTIQKYFSNAKFKA